MIMTDIKSQHIDIDDDEIESTPQPQGILSFTIPIQKPFCDFCGDDEAELRLVSDYTDIYLKDWRPDPDVLVCVNCIEKGNYK